MIDHLKEKFCVPTTFVQLNAKSWGNLAICTIKTTTLALEHKCLRIPTQSNKKQHGFEVMFKLINIPHMFLKMKFWDQWKQWQLCVFQGNVFNYTKRLSQVFGTGESSHHLLHLSLNQSYESIRWHVAQKGQKCLHLSSLLTTLGQSEQIQSHKIVQQINGKLLAKWILTDSIHPNKRLTKAFHCRNPSSDCPICQIFRCHKT